MTNKNKCPISFEKMQETKDTKILRIQTLHQWGLKSTEGKTDNNSQIHVLGITFTITTVCLFMQRVQCPRTQFHILTQETQSNSHERLANENPKRWYELKIWKFNKIPSMLSEILVIPSISVEVPDSVGSKSKTH